MLGGVAFTRDDLVFDVLTLLVTHFQRAAVGRDDFDFEFAIGSVKLGIGWTVGDRGLVADVLANVAEGVHHVSREAGLVETATGHPSKGLELVISLEPVDRTGIPIARHSVRHSAAVVRLAVIPQLPAYAHAKN